MTRDPVSAESSDMAPRTGIATRRGLFWAVVDVVLVCLAAAAAVSLHHSPLAVPAPAAEGVLFLAGAHVATGSTIGLYRGRWHPGSFEEMTGVVATASGSMLLLVVWAAATSALAPVGALLITAVLLLCATIGARFVTRLLMDARLRRVRGVHRVVVVGAGDGGLQVVRAMLRRPGDGFQPVALIDDDPRKRRLRLLGVQVAGDLDALADVLRRTGADTVLLAVPSASAALVRRVSDIARGTSATLRVLPAVSELTDGCVQLSDIRPVSYSDLLGRGEVVIDAEAVTAYLTGARVLVTGAGGSIGAEICHQLVRHDLACLVMLDRDESALHGLQLSMSGRALLDDDGLVVADIRDKARMLEVFRQHRPDVVFHAAALKHLTLLEQHPGEAVKTNVFGTLNVLDAARVTGVGRFVNISTDKAADASSVLGWSKRLGERLTSGVAVGADGTYVSVRFGNVLGSRGSVIPAFLEQIRTGGPVTVTDPEVQRYFMTVQEAVRLVLQAGAIGGAGETLVLDMGEPVVIADVARRLIELSGRPTEVVFTGLRQGEKLTEVLLNRDEVDRRPLHPSISHVRVPPLNRRQLDPLLDPGSCDQISRMLRTVAETAPLFIDVAALEQARLVAQAG
jgi:FlaA1/EpsC-like NDP-sugar epimerase